MGPYLYATLDVAAVADDGSMEGYLGITIEDVKNDYLEVARFCGESFATDVTAYLDWSNAAMSRNEALEIYESDTLREACQRIFIPSD